MHAGPTYSDNHAHIYSVTDLNVYYGQLEWSIIPRLSITNSPYRHYFHWEVFAGYNLPFSEKGEIIFNQNDANKVGTIPITQKGYQVNYNGRPITATPYHLYGLEVGATIGISFSSLLEPIK